MRVSGEAASRVTGIRDTHDRLSTPLWEFRTTLLYAIHIVLDLFTVPTPLLWPKYWEAYMISIEVVGFIEPGAEIGIVPHVELYSEPVKFVMHRVEGPIVSTPGVLIAIALTSLLLIDRIDVPNRGQHHYR